VKSYETVEPVPFGNYQLVERLAMGGMAEVYLARPSQGAASDRFVALKRILPNIAEDDEFIAMFIDEAKIAGQLNHANVATIFDLGKINQSYFIAMEYVSGHDLRALWDRTRDAAPNGKNALPIGLACHITKKICEGLDYAHRKRDAKGRPLGIIHRDVSPQNVLISYDGDLKIIDFGIAKAANRIVRTQTGILKGKFAYMAPEQARGEPTDHRADIFAIGVILYELLTGERAFKAESDFALLEKVRKVDIVSPRQFRPEIPKDLERILLKAMQKEPADRYSWASALAADLDRFMSDQGFASSKEELGAYLQRMFKAEFLEEQKRLKTYRAIFGDGSEVASQTMVRSLPSEDSMRSDDRSSEEAAAEEGTEVGDAVSDDGIDASADPSTRMEESRGARAAPHTQGASGPSAASRATLMASMLSQDSAPESDRTQLEAGDDAPPPPKPAGPVVVARDEIARSKVKVVRSGSNSRPSAERSLSGPSSSRPRAQDAPPPFSPSPLDAVPDDAAEAFSDRTVEKGAERGSERAPERSTPRGSAAERSGRSRSGASQSVPIGVVVSAAVLGAVIGAGAVGIGVLMSSSNTPDTIIVSEPRQAEVKRGDVVLCAQTPCAVALGAGRHALTFRAPGAEAITKDVEVKSGEIARVDVSLDRAREDLRLETVPAGAQVILDGVPLPSTTPVTLPRLKVGSSVRLKLMRDGNQPLEVARVVDDAPTWRYELPTSATTWVITPKPADALVLLSSGRPTEKDGKLLMSVGANKVIEVRAERPGCTSRFEKLRPTGVGEAKLDLTLECKPMAKSGLTIEGPRRVGVRIDNTELGKGANLERYPLPPGTWNVILRSRNKTESFTVEIAEGEFRKITSKLK
jgi:eukaryotic-like serine/threonine-protein kinase